VSKQTKEFSELLKDGQKIGALEATREGIQAVAPGLSLSKLFNDIKAEAKEQAKMGAHELATALLRGSDGYVMYQRSGKEGQSMEGQGLHGQQEQGYVQRPEQEQSRGGREM